MNKSIELTKSQIRALENGATMLMFPICEMFNSVATVKCEDDEHQVNLSQNLAKYLFTN